MERDPFTGEIISCAIGVHRVLGPGLLESTYQQCLTHELHLNEIPFKLASVLSVLSVVRIADSNWYFRRLGRVPKATKTAKTPFGSA